MDYRAQSDLGSLCKDLLADLERLRPGWQSAAATEADLRREVQARVDLRLEELFQADLGQALEPAEAQEQLALYRREVDQILVPRYALLAQRQNQIERARPEALRGAGLYNRLAYGLMFFALGVFMVWAPFIPLWDKWIPFLLAALSPIFTPWLPDLYRAFTVRRHQLQLVTLLIDMDQSGAALPAAATRPALPAPGPGAPLKESPPS